MLEGQLVGPVNEVKGESSPDDGHVTPTGSWTRRQKE